MVASRYIFYRATLVWILHACNFIFLNFQFLVHKLKSPQDPTPKKNPSSSQIFFPSMSVIIAINFPLFLCPFVRSLHRFSSLKSQYVSSLFFSFPSGIFTIWLLYCWIVINLVLFCFPISFARLGTNTGGGSVPLAQKKKKKRDLGPLTKKLLRLWNCKPLTHPASPHVKKKKKKKGFSPKM